MVLHLLASGANVHDQSPQYGMALDGASFSGHTEVVSILLEAGANVNGEPHGSRPRYDTPLTNAVRSNHIDTVSILLAAGADVHVWVAAGGRYEDLLDADDDSDDEEEELPYANALLEAAAYSSAEMVTMILNAAGCKTIDYMSYALRLAAGVGSMDVVQVLIAAGADVRAHDDIAFIQALWGGHADVASALLAEGCSVNARDGKALRAAMHHLLLGGGESLELIRLVLDAGADVHADGEYALHAAVSWGYPPAVPTLLMAGADVNVQKWDK